MCPPLPSLILVEIVVVNHSLISYCSRFLVQHCKPPVCPGPDPSSSPPPLRAGCIPNFPAIALSLMPCASTVPRVALENRDLSLMCAPHSAHNYLIFLCYFTLSNNPHYWFIPNLAYSPVTVTRLSATTWLRLLLSPFLINTFIPICCSKSGLWPFDYCYLVCTALYYYPHPVTFSYPLPYSSHNPLYLYVIVVPYRELLLS